MKEVTIEGVKDWLLGSKLEMQSVEDRLEFVRIEKEVMNIESNLGWWDYNLSGDRFDYHFYCECCGKPESSSWAEDTKERILNNKLCFKCLFWRDKEREHLDAPKIIINGVCHADGGSNKGSKHNGFGGSKFKLRHICTGEVFETNNLWCNGDIPLRLRVSTMKNTHEVI